MPKKALAVKRFDELKELIQKSEPLIRPDYVAGYYRFMAKIDAIEAALISKGVLTKGEIDDEMAEIFEAMKKDFQ